MVNQIFDPPREISNNVVCATGKASDQIVFDVCMRFHKSCDKMAV